MTLPGVQAEKDQPLKPQDLPRQESPSRENGVESVDDSFELKIDEGTHNFSLSLKNQKETDLLTRKIVWFDQCLKSLGWAGPTGPKFFRAQSARPGDFKH